MSKVFISGPYSKGDVCRNIREAVDAANAVVVAGHLPFVPHLIHLWDMICPRSYEEWMKYCIAWVSSCDCLIRLPGESPGADREVAEAVRLGLPVFDDTQDFLKHIGFWG